MKKGNESNRPGNTTKWIINSPITIHVQSTDKIEYATVDHRGHMIFRSLMPVRPATVIKGKRGGKNIKINTDDTVFSCIFGSSGHLSSLPPGHSGEEVTIIIH